MIVSIFSGRWYTALQALVIIALVISVGISNLANRVLYGQVPPAFSRKVNSMK